MNNTSTNAKGALSVLKTEFNKLRFNKTSQAIAVVAVLLAVLFYVLIVPQIARCSYSERRSHAEIMDGYRQRCETIELLKAYSEGEDVELPAGVIPDRNFDYSAVKLEHEKLKFLIETDTPEYEYLNIENLESNTSANLGSVQMLWTGNMSAPVFLFLCIFLGVGVFLRDNKGGIKNYYASGLKRKSVFAGKLLYAEIFILLAFIFACLVGIFFGLSSSAPALMLINGSWQAVSAFALFGARMVGVFVFAQIMFFLIVALGSFTRDIFVAAAAPALLYFIMWYVCTLLKSAFSIEAAFFPIMALQLVTAPLWDIGCLIYLIVHAAIAVGMFFLARRSRKTDVTV